MKNYIVLAIIILFFSCGGGSEMEETIFIPDTNDKDLPAYSEWGYNSFGAMYERRYFFSTKDIVPCKVIYGNGKLTFTLSGRTGLSYSSRGNGDNLTLSITFPVNTPINNYRDLLLLHQKIINLSDSSCEVRMTSNAIREELTGLSGELTFNRAQLLRINDVENRIILSGTFELLFWRNQIPEIMSKGRFDVGITHVFISPL